ncbi:hypothetical protein [Bacillus haynesii]|nr:hypothetical protein [Bacillus haynesii]
MSYIGQKANSRAKWEIKPTTRIKESKKKYDRKKDKQKLKKELFV